MKDRGHSKCVEHCSGKHCVVLRIGCNLVSWCEVQGRNTDRKTKRLHNSWELHSVVLANSAAECSESREDTSWERTGTEGARHRDLARLARIAADSCSRQRDCSERRSHTAVPWSCRAQCPICYTLPPTKQ